MFVNFICIIEATNTYWFHNCQITISSFFMPLQKKYSSTKKYHFYLALEHNNFTAALPLKKLHASVWDLTKGENEKQNFF